MTCIFCKKKIVKTFIPAWNKGSNILLPHIWSHHHLLCSMTKLKEHSREICYWNCRYVSDIISCQWTRTKCAAFWGLLRQTRDSKCASLKTPRESIRNPWWLRTLLQKKQLYHTGHIPAQNMRLRDTWWKTPLSEDVRYNLNNSTVLPGPKLKTFRASLQCEKWSHRLGMSEKGFELQLLMGWLLLALVKREPLRRSLRSSVVKWGVWCLRLLGSTTWGSAVINEWGAQMMEQCSHGFCVTPDYRLEGDQSNLVHWCTRLSVWNDAETGYRVQGGDPLDAAVFSLSSTHQFWKNDHPWK